MGLIQKLQEAELPESTRVTLRMEHGDDVVHAWDGYEEKVISDSDIVSEMTSVATYPGDPLGLLDNMRTEGMLDGYDRSDPEECGWFEEYVHDVLNEEARAHGWIETETEQYDYKRGFCTAYVELTTTVGNLVENMPNFHFGGWTAQVSTKLGNLTIDNY